MKAVIIDYNMGNVASVQKALNFLNIPNEISNNYEVIKQASHLILPGVGAFAQGMQNIVKYNLDKILTDEVIVNKKPFLGICLGMQLIAENGVEPYDTKGLGWIEGTVKKINLDNRTVPHLGWNNITIKNKDSLIKKFNNKDFYFIHSYHFDVIKKENILATVNYEKDFVAIIKKDNILAMQFHPEKSQTNGLNLLNTFFSPNA